MFLLGTEPVDLSQAVKTGTVAHDLFNHRVERAIGTSEMLAQVPIRKFNRNKAVLPVGRTPGAEGISASNVKGAGEWLKIQFLFRPPNGAGADQIQAQFNTLALNRARPFGDAGSFA